MEILVDCGGSGVKIAACAKGETGETRCFKPKTLDEFCECIKDVAKGGNPTTHAKVTGLAISICGEYDYVNEKVVSCWAYPFLIGRLKDKLAKRFECDDVHVVNDGDAHALALKAICAQKGKRLAGAINLSLGTAVGFGILDCNGDLLHTCQGHNWEVGQWQCDTKARQKEQYWALGSQGLKALESECGRPEAYVRYGQRLCHFLVRDLIPVFHPKIIGLSGGIVAAHSKNVEEGIRSECKLDQGARLKVSGADIYLSTERHSVMRGLAGLLHCDDSGRLASANNPPPILLPENAGGMVECSLVGFHAGKTVCAEDAGRKPLVANREKFGGDWERFALSKNEDGTFSLKSAANGKYVSAIPPSCGEGALIAQGEKVDDWEKFKLKEVAGNPGVYTLWSLAAEKYVCVDENKGNALIADRDVADEWEWFRILPMSDVEAWRN